MSGGVPAGEGLKACPFCNSAAAVFWYDGFPQVRCDECGAATGMFTTGDEREAITAWNTRATPTPPIEGRDAGVERVARAMCVADGLDPDEHIVGGQATGFEDFGPLWQAEDRSEGQLGLTDYTGLARAALQALGERG